jgi:hypothetical protein
MPAHRHAVPGRHALKESRLDDHLRGLDRTLSRTVATGTIDRTASPAKRPALVTGSALLARIAANRRLVARFIAWRRRAWPATAAEHFGVICTLAHLAGLGIFPAGLFREWEYDAGRHGVAGHPVPRDEVPAALLGFAGEISRARALRAPARIELVARTEWEIGIGPLHPFYDGCGRISRYTATLLSLWLDVPVVTHASRDAYLGAARAGRDAFVTYYRRCLRDGEPCAMTTKP